MTQDPNAPKAPDAVEFANDLKGIGLNMLTSNVAILVDFLTNIMDLAATYADEDFAIIHHEGVVFMVHSDASYAQNPLLSLTGDGVIRGAGLEVRLYDVDPDHAALKAEAAGFHILEQPTTKAHGLREAYIIGPDGYCWVPCKRAGMS